MGAFSDTIWDGTLVPLRQLRYSVAASLDGYIAGRTANSTGRHRPRNRFSPLCTPASARIVMGPPLVRRIRINRWEVWAPYRSTLLANAARGRARRRHVRAGRGSHVRASRLRLSLVNRSGCGARRAVPAAGGGWSRRRRRPRDRASHPGWRRAAPRDSGAQAATAVAIASRLCGHRHADARVRRPSRRMNGASPDAPAVTDPISSWCDGWASHRPPVDLRAPARPPGTGPPRRGWCRRMA